MGVCEDVTVCEGVTVGDCEGVTVGDCEGVGVAVGVSVGVGVAQALDEIVGEGDVPRVEGVHPVDGT